MTMKTNRQQAIARLIASEEIDTQEGLLKRLSEEGYRVTQATISRDIRELGIHKVRGENGGYHYVTRRSDDDSRDLSSKFAFIFSESALSVNYAQNIVVVKCHTGMANAACATFDAAKIEDVVGTLSGDDTFLIIAATTEAADHICTMLRSHIED